MNNIDRKKYFTILDALGNCYCSVRYDNEQLVLNGEHCELLDDLENALAKAREIARLLLQENE